jgi:amino acid transporter
MIFGESGSVDLIKLAGQPQIGLMLGTFLVTAAFVGLFFPQRVIVRILGVGVGLGLLAWVVILATFNANSTGTFQTAWNQVRGADSFLQVIPSAESLGFRLSSDPMGFLAPGLTVGLWLFFGFLSTFSLAGEVRKPETTLLGGSWLALAVSGLVFCAGLALVQHVLPPDWLAAESFLSQQPGYTGEAQPNLTLYAATLIDSIPLMLLIFWGWLLCFVVFLQVFIQWIGRTLLAWADDGMLPAGMAYVHPRFRSPLVTMLIAAVLVQVGYILYEAGAFTPSLANVDFFGAVALLLPVCAVTVFPFLRRSWFESSPAFVRQKIGPLPLVTLAGLAALAYLGFVLAAPFFAPVGGRPMPLGDLLIFGILVVLGSGWYWGRRLSLRARGIRLEDEVKGIPRLS